MLGLMQTEIYGSKGVINGLHSAIKDAMALQLTRNIGVIAPNQMEPEMLQLKVSRKSPAITSKGSINKILVAFSDSVQLVI